MGNNTVGQVAAKRNCSKQKIFAGIRLGLIRAERFGNAYIITDEEVERLKKNPFTLKRGDYRK